MPSSPEYDHLFAAPLKTFVAERKRLADALKASGRPQEAKEILKTPRPGISAWIVNQLARHEAPLVGRLAETTASLQGAQRRLADAERVPGYAEMLAAHRETLRQLRARAEEILAASGQAVRPQILERVVRNLRVGLADAEIRPVIESGRLVRDVAETDFASLLDALRPKPDGAGSPAERQERTAPVVARDQVARQAGERAEREAAARAGEEARARARAEAEQAREAERARARARAEEERRIKVLRGEAAGARMTLEKSERGVEAARQAQAEAEDRLRRARQAWEQAARELQEAEAAFDGQGTPGPAR